MAPRFQVKYTVSTRSFKVFEHNDLKLTWRVANEEFELKQDSKLIVQSHAQVLNILEFFSLARRQHEDFLTGKNERWRSEVLKMVAHLDEKVSAVCQEDENTRQLFTTIKELDSGTLITFSAADMEKMLSCTSSINGIKVDAEYNPAHGNSGILPAHPAPAAVSVAARYEDVEQGSGRRDAQGAGRSSGNSSRKEGSSSSGSGGGSSSSSSSNRHRPNVLSRGTPSGKLAAYANLTNNMKAKESADKNKPLKHISREKAKPEPESSRPVAAISPSSRPRDASMPSIDIGAIFQDTVADDFYVPS